MKLISTRVHGVLDIILALVFLASPWLFGFADLPIPKWTAVAVSVALLIMASLTRYELGLFNIIPMPVHLVIDLLVGIILVASPWILDVTGGPRAVFVSVGVLEVLSAVMTRNRRP
ncbi:SPW repeat domain-containing protein [Mucilaginibacter daejeonensis]